MAPRGKIVLLSTFDGNIAIPALSLVARNLQYMGCATAPRGRAMRMLQFASETNIKPRVERFPLTAQGISQAMRLMRDGLIRYRAVFTRVGA
jgi:D-arabinose 1-dehydrogenase-like Zn-dependent alcohol dehydrogenase